MTLPDKQQTYGLGLVLSGGGAKGFAHLGVFKALEEYNIATEIIAGTSAGAFAGVFYADGKKPEEILSLFENKAFKEFAELTIPQVGLFKTDRFKNFLKKNLKAKTFEELQIPLKIVATDLVNGTSVVFEKGPLIPAVLASCAFPIVFTPVEINKIHYVDGGLFKNFPVSIIRSECDTILGVNVAPLIKQKYKNSLLHIAERSFHYISVSNSLIDRRLCDILIETDRLSKYAMFTLDHTREIYEIGYNEAIRVLSEQKNSLVNNKK